MKQLLNNLYIKSWKRFNSYKLHKLETFDLNITFDDLFTSSDKRSTDFLLGFYSRLGIEYALKRHNIFKILNTLGFHNLKLVTDFENPFKQRVAVYSEKILPEYLLGELVTQKKGLDIQSISTEIKIDDHMNFISLEWLCLQHPLMDFSKDKPRLPGQSFPGLGLGKYILTILYLMNWQLGLNGLINIPEYYHNAAMYSKKFKFIDPHRQGLLKILKSDLQNTFGMATLSWAIDRGFVFLNGEPFKWFTSPQIIPSNQKLKLYFSSENYIRISNETYLNNKIDLDLEGFINSLEELSIPGYSEFFLPILKTE